jgi:hypothetical protein
MSFEGRQEIYSKTLEVCMTVSDKKVKKKTDSVGGPII